MNQKRGASTLFSILLMIIIIILIFGPQRIELLTTGKYYTSTNSITTNTETKTIYEPSSVDLCDLFQPYIIPSHVVATCSAMGGDWVCRDDFVGCTNAAGIIDCSGPVIQSAMYQCQSVGGEYSCDLNNAYCVI